MTKTEALLKLIEAAEKLVIAVRECSAGMTPHEIWRIQDTEAALADAEEAISNSLNLNEKVAAELSKEIRTAGFDYCEHIGRPLWYELAHRMIRSTPDAG